MTLRPTGVYLTERFFVQYGLLQLSGIVGLTIPLLLWIYFCGMIVLVVMVLLDRRTLLFSYREVTIRFQGGAQGRLARDSLGLFEEAEISIDAVPGPGKIFQSKISADLPPLRFLEKQESKTILQMTKKEEGHYGFLGKIKIKGAVLGREELKTVHVFCPSKAGLWVRISAEKVVPLEIQVNPRLKKLSEQEFVEITRRNRLYMGQRQKMRGQAADQYYTTRKFQYPDSPRYIDQKRTARLGEIMTKTFEEIRNHHLIIAFDLGRTMSGEIAASPKRDFYLAGALAMAKHAIECRDTVDFFAFSQKIHFNVAQARSFSPFLELTRRSKALECRVEETNYSLIPRMVSRLTGQRSIVVLLTDLSRPSVQESLLTALAPVCRKHLVVALGLIDNDFSLDTQIMKFSGSNIEAKEASSLIYDYWLNEQLQLFQNKLVRIGGGSLTLSEENWMSVIERLYANLRQSLFA